MLESGLQLYYYLGTGSARPRMVKARVAIACHGVSRGGGYYRQDLLCVSGGKTGLQHSSIDTGLLDSNRHHHRCTTVVVPREFRSVDESQASVCAKA